MEGTEKGGLYGSPRGARFGLAVKAVLSPFLTGRMFVRRTYFGHFDEL